MDAVVLLRRNQSYWAGGGVVEVGAAGASSGVAGVSTGAGGVAAAGFGGCSRFHLRMLSAWARSRSFASSCICARGIPIAVMVAAPKTIMAVRASIKIFLISLSLYGLCVGAHV